MTRSPVILVPGPQASHRSTASNRCGVKERLEHVTLTFAVPTAGPSGPNRLKPRVSN